MKLLLNGAEVRMSEGYDGTGMAALTKAQTASISYSIPRTNIDVLGRYKPLNNRPVVNYTPVSLNVDFIKSSSEIEQNLGLVNSTGVGFFFINNSNTVNGYGCRNFEVLIAPATSNNYNGQINIYSGCLSTYTLTASVTEPARASFAVEGLDLSQISNNDPKTLSTDDGTIVKPSDVQINGLDFSGFGVSGIVIQSFSLSINWGRQSVFRLGNKFPNRPPTTLTATLSINGFLEGINDISGLQMYDCGAPYTGELAITLTPSCTTGYSTTIYVQNPYIDSVSYGASIGSFTSIDLAFSIPLSVVQSEMETGSNLIII